jgi:hypothetical protein
LLGDGYAAVLERAPDAGGAARRPAGICAGYGNRRLCTTTHLTPGGRRAAMRRAPRSPGSLPTTSPSINRHGTATRPAPPRRAMRGFARLAQIPISRQAVLHTRRRCAEVVVTLLALEHRSCRPPALAS